MNHLEEILNFLKQSNILDSVDDIFAISDEFGKIVYLNSKGKKTARCTKNDLENDFPFCYDLFNCTVLQKIPTYCPSKEQNAKRVDSPFQMMTRIEDDYYKFNCTPIYDEENKLKYILHIAKDETERVYKEQKLTHLNSLLKSIRNFNQYIYLERDPEKIIREACEILYQTQNYVFVGILTSNTTLFKKNQFYKSSLPIELDFDNSKEKEIYLYFKEKSEKQLLDFSKFSKNLREPTQYEFTFSNETFFGILIPISSQNKCFGYLLVISRSPEKFHSEEIEFLQEYADDIAVSFDSIQNLLQKEELEKKTRELERFYYTLLSNLPGFVYRCRNDRHWTMEFISENFYYITGYKPEEIIGNKILSFNDLIHKDHQERLWVKWQILLHKREVFQDEYPIITKNGETRWVFEQGRGIYDEKGNVIALEGYITDITERKLLEEKLKESERKYRALFENSADAIFILSGDIFLDCNLSALNMFNCERKDIIGKPPYEFSPQFQPDGVSSRKKAIEYINRAYRGEELRFEWRHQTLDGREFDCEVTLNKIIYGKKSFLLAIVHEISKLKQAFNEIQKMAKALDSIGEAVSITDISNKFIYVNKAFEKIYGYSFEEIKGKTPYIIRPKDLYEVNIDREIFDSLAKNQLWRGELWNIDKFGRKFFIHLTVNSLTDSQGNTIGYVGVAVDLTERLQMEHDLRDREEKFRSLVSSLDDIVYTLDKEHKHSGLYGRWAKNWGLKEEDFLGKNALEILGPEGGKIHIEMQERCFKGETVTYEWSSIHANQTFYFQTRISPLRDLNGNIIGIVGVGRDITKLKQLELELLKFYQIVEQTPTGVIIIDLEGKIIYLNSSLETILGVQRVDLIGDKIQSIQSKNLDPKYFDDIFQKLSKEQFFSIEINIDKLKKWVRTRFFPIKDNSGKLINYVGLINDITNEKEYIQKLTEAKEKAEELSSLKSYLLMNFSHEFRTPLNGIMGWAQVLMYNNPDTEIQQIGKTIYKSGLRFLNTVEMIVDYSKIETGYLKPQLKTFDIVDTIKEVAFLVKDNFENENIDFNFNTEVETLEVELDEYMVRTIAHALVHNAFKFTRNGGINVIIRKINSNDSGAYVELIVSDSGIGIPEEELENIWKEFYQVSQGISREFEGQGLGLSIAKKFTEILGGKIDVHSVVGKGSTFIVKIPLRYSQKV